MNLYIYYRVRPEQEDGCRRGVAHLQAALGSSARLLRARDDPHTWMEVYENVPEDFAEALALAAARHDFNRFLAEGSQRHMECFVECA